MIAKIRVLNCLHRAHFGGAQWRVVWVGDELRKHGVETTVLFPKNQDSAYEMFLQKRRFPYVRVKVPGIRARRKILANLGFLLDLPFQIFRIKRLLLEGSFGIVHANGLTNIGPVLAGFLAGVPVVWHWNDTLTPRWFAALVLPFLGRRSWLVVASNAVFSSYELSQYEKRYLGVVPPPIQPIDDSLPKENISWDKPVVGFVGNLLREKGIFEFVRAIDALNREGTPVTGVAVGGPLSGHEADLESLQREIASLQFGSKVLLLGYRHDVPSLMQNFDVLLFPSYSEAAPIVVLQALATGVPIVSTPVGCVPEWLADTQMQMVPVGDVGAMVKAVKQQLSSNEPELATYRATVSKLIRSRYSIEAVSMRHIEIYRHALHAT